MGCPTLAASKGKLFMGKRGFRSKGDYAAMTRGKALEDAGVEEDEEEVEALLQLPPAAVVGEEDGEEDGEDERPPSPERLWEDVLAGQKVTAPTSDEEGASPSSSSEGQKASLTLGQASELPSWSEPKEKRASSSNSFATGPSEAATPATDHTQKANATLTLMARFREAELITRVVPVTNESASITTEAFYANVLSSSGWDTFAMKESEIHNNQPMN